MNGLHCGPLGNKKIEKACAMHNDLEVDIVSNMNFAELFNGGEAEKWSVVVENVDKNTSRIQEGGTFMMMFGPIIEHLELMGSIKMTLDWADGKW